MPQKLPTDDAGILEMQRKKQADAKAQHDAEAASIPEGYYDEAEPAKDASDAYYRLVFEGRDFTGARTADPAVTTARKDFLAKLEIRPEGTLDFGEAQIREKLNALADKLNPNLPAQLRGLDLQLVAWAVMTGLLPIDNWDAAIGSSWSLVAREALGKLAKTRTLANAFKEWKHSIDNTQSGTGSASGNELDGSQLGGFGEGGRKA